MVAQRNQIPINWSVSAPPATESAPFDTWETKKAADSFREGGVSCEGVPTEVDDSGDRPPARQLLHEPIQELLAVEERLDQHALVAAMRAGVIHVAEQTRHAVR